MPRGVLYRRRKQKRKDFDPHPMHRPSRFVREAMERQAKEREAAATGPSSETAHWRALD